MRRFVLAVVLALCASPAVAQPKQQKVAFLVGVGTFKHALADLGGVPEKDVAELQQLLAKNGYRVVTVTGEKATKKEIEERFKRLLGGGDGGTAVGKGDIVLVQLCTHGFTIESGDKREPYLAGYDARPDDPKTLLGLNDMIRTAAPFGATTLFLVDACRESSDPNRGANRGVEGGRMTLPKSTAVLFSCAQGQVAHQSDSLGHGLFTYAALKALRGETGLAAEITWADLVSHVGKAFRTNEFKKHIPVGRPQTPLAVQGETEDVELVSLRPAAAVVEKRADWGHLRADHKQVQQALMAGGDELGACLRRLVPERAAEWKAASDAGDVTGHALYALCLIDGIGHPQDEKLARDLLVKAADAGDSWAMTGLGFLYFTGGGPIDKDHKQAFAWYTKAAAKKNPAALHTLGVMHNEALGVPEDTAKALELFRESADREYVPAFVSLGRAYEFGDGVPKDFKQARAWYEKADAKDSEDATHRIGQMYRFGRGVTADHAKALEYFRRAVKRFYAPSMNSLGELYDAGRGVDQDAKAAAEWFRKSALRGHTPGMNNFADALLFGRGVKQDDEAGFDWYKRSALAGDDDGMERVAFLYDTGRGTAVSYADALRWYREADRLGNTSAAHGLGFMYARGRGVKADYAEAMRLYQRAAKAGNAMSMNNIGFLYQNGHGVEKDYKEAMNWYQKAADAGNVVGSSNMAYLYSNGLGVTRDAAKAVELYTVAAKGGNKIAMTSLGEMLQAGTGTKADAKAAVEWYRKAAAGSQPNAKAAYLLAGCYEKGTGVAKDIAKAREWYEKAAAAGHKEAKAALERLK